MNSAIFQSAADAAAQRADRKGKPASQGASSASAAEQVLAKAKPVVKGPAAAREPFDWPALWGRILPPVGGLALLIGIWALLTMKGGAFPTPAATFDAAVKLFANPFYQNGPNDQGIGWNILFSLERVGLGFGMAAIVGIPLGFLIGRFATLNRMVSPLISLLKPVSPLAWLPIGLLVFKAANPAAIWTIFICSIWPMVINTAVGVQRVPEDYLNVARVLKLSEWKIATRILLPSVMPYMLTGVRLSVGTAWLVIVAAEMLTGAPGVGGFLWQEYNSLIYEHIILCILTIGIMGFILDRMLGAVELRLKGA